MFETQVTPIKVITHSINLNKDTRSLFANKTYKQTRLKPLLDNKRAILERKAKRWKKNETRKDLPLLITQAPSIAVNCKGGTKTQLKTKNSTKLNIRLFTK